jgi:hypothetical protein
MSDISSDDASTTQTTPLETIGSPQNILKAKFELLATYLANSWVPEQYRITLDRICDTVKNFSEPQQTTTNAIRTLHKAVQQLASKVDSNARAHEQRTPQGALSYAAVAGRGVPIAAATAATTAVKPVPA